MMVKDRLKSIIKSAGYEIRRHHPNLVEFLHSRSVNLVLDVGANEGQFVQEIRSKGYTGKVVSFEPVADVFERLEKNCATDKNWHCRNVALGETIGTIEINVSKNTAMSSIANQTEIGRKSIYATDVIRVEEVRIATLDSIYSEFADERVFLKVDTQGFEQHVLRGGGNSLRRLLGVQLELPLVHLYEGTWKFDEALLFMREAGFTLSQMRPVTYYSQDPVSLLEVDCIFKRTEASDEIKYH
ncbi:MULTISPECIES: FkbM family methyltransferase [unclassified Bradyrhizobium]|uniref:FkbM family methyltransferase n=1 Tax=unclassified Bradyrhizobium TaxID=2631580 RepID=UPI0024799CD6|nr:MULTISPECIES: FkbM family methyltransferase [unclassified Bradyrhizobium]WGR69681.1 FkbM family methyltransferase [Bradyrhizobium sp. ISRA426]WGR81738.1 FkbM family methyltransferase [Bradyrhizobium sp. ISRA430]WGR84923.1 FkbM family methyltransferase [Bradyrhizobium sp. ISRA432]